MGCCPHRWNVRRGQGTPVLSDEPDRTDEGGELADGA
jgi:hypothetical protein